MLTSAWMALVCATADPWAAFAGQPVLTVEVRAPAGHEARGLRGTVDISEGARLEPEAVRRAMKRLWAVGRFAQVEVFATQRQQTVALCFVLTPQPRLAGITIQGLREVSEGELVRALRLLPNDEIDAQTPLVVRRRARSLLARRGLPNARVDVEQVARGEPGFWQLVLRVDEGPARRAARVVFGGSPRLPLAWLADLVETRAGDRIDLDRLDRDRDALTAAYRERGFSLVRVTPPVVHEVDGETQVSFVVVAGPRLAVTTAGHALLGRQQLFALMPEPDAGGMARLMGTWSARIRSAYERQGYPFARLRVAGPKAGAQGVQQWRLTVDEGPAASVERVLVRGLDALEHQVVVDQIGVVLADDLGEMPLFTPLDAGEEGSPPWRLPAARRPRPVPARRRWVPELYRVAAGQVAHGLVEVGYPEARVDLVGARLAGTQAPAERRALADGCRRWAASHGSIPCPLQVEVEVRQGPQAFAERVGFKGEVDKAAAGRPLAALLEMVAEAPAGGDEPQAAALAPPPLGPGQPLSPRALEEGRIRLVKSLRDDGYLFARVREEVVAAAQPVLWRQAGYDVDFAVDAGPRVRVNQVLLRGNRHTRDATILARMRLSPGDIYRLQAAVEDQHRVAELGVFRSVRVRLIDEEHPGGAKDLVAEVSERNRHLLEVVPGISSANGPRLAARYSHLNLAGTASRLAAGLKVNRQVFFGLYGSRGPGLRERFDSYRGWEQLTLAVDREATLGLRSPPLARLAFDPLLRLDLVALRVNTLRYSFSSERLIVGVDGVHGERLRGTLEGQLGLTTLECNPLDPACDQDRNLRHQQSRPLEVGRHWIAKVGPQVAWDRRDRPLDPRRGFHAGGRVAVAHGAQLPSRAGGRADSAQAATPFTFAKVEAGFTGYLPAGRGSLALAARIGVIPRARARVPLEERFFLGGRDTLRGWVESTLIPEDACFVADSSLAPPPGCAGTFSPSQPNPDGSSNPPLSSGGHAFLLLKAELRVPLRDQLALALFTDWGNLWLDPGNLRPDRLRPSAGMGLRYLTPVGALALDFGVNLRRRAQPRDEALAQLHFSVGSF